MKNDYRGWRAKKDGTQSKYTETDFWEFGDKIHWKELFGGI